VGARQEEDEDAEDTVADSPLDDVISKSGAKVGRWRTLQRTLQWGRRRRRRRAQSRKRKLERTLKRAKKRDDGKESDVAAEERHDDDDTTTTTAASTETTLNSTPKRTYQRLSVLGGLD